MFELAAQDAKVGVLSLRGFELSFGLGHRFVRIDTCFIECLGQSQRFLERDDRVIQQFLQRVLSANTEIIHSDFRLHRQARIFEVRRAGLCCVRTGSDSISDAAE